MYTESQKQACRKYYQKNKELILIKKRQYQKTNQDKIKKHRSLYNETHKSHASSYVVSYTRKLRIKALEIYDSKCSYCSENDIDVLEFDHVNDDGHMEERDKHNNRMFMGGRLYRGLINGILNIHNYQILCCNCNRKKHLINTELNRLNKHNISPF